MNAKEISDETLESITPADNDLLVIYDTSTGTTGKSTIEDLKDVLNTVETINYTASAGVTVNEGNIKKINKLVIGNLTLKVSSASDYMILLSNLPKPKNVINFSFNIAYTGSQLYPCCGYISTSGELRTRLLGGVSSGSLYISFAYIV